MTSRSPRGAAHPGNGVIAPFHGERPRNRGVKDTHRPPFSAPSSRRRPSETAIRTASPALTLKSFRPGTTNRSRLRNGVGRYEPDRRGPDPGRPGPACAMRAQRDAVHLTSRRASPARHNPPELDSREPTWRNASPGDITETTPPWAGRPRGWRHRLGEGVGHPGHGGAASRVAAPGLSAETTPPRGWGTCRRTARSARPRASGPPGTIVPVIVNDCVDVGPPRAARDGRRAHIKSRTGPPPGRPRRIIRRMCTFRRSRAIFPPVSARGVAGTCARGRPWGNLALVRATARVRTSLLLSRRGGA